MRKNPVIPEPQTSSQVPNWHLRGSSNYLKDAMALETQNQNCEATERVAFSAKEEREQCWRARWNLYERYTTEVNISRCFKWHWGGTPLFHESTLKAWLNVWNTITRNSWRNICLSAFR